MKQTGVWLLVLMLAVGTAFAAPRKGLVEENIPALNVPKMTVPPKIDGVIDPVEWRESVKVMGVIGLANPGYKDRPIAFRVAWDAEHLYIAAVSDILPGHRMWRQRRDRFTTGVVYDDSYEFGIFLHDRNKLPGEASSFQKMVINSLGAGEYMKIYPSIGQNMYNWQPDPELANRIYEEGGRQWWALELAMDLADLQLPAPNKAGDRVDLLLAADLKNPAWQWLDFPSASGHLEHYGFPRLVLTETEPYIQIDQFSGLNDEKVDLKAVVRNPGPKPVTVNALLQATYNPPPKSPEKARVVVDVQRTLEIPAGGVTRFDVAQAFPGLGYEKTQWGGFVNWSHVRIQLRKTNAEDAPAVYNYFCNFAGTDKSYLIATPRTTPFDCGVTFNPASNRLNLVGDTLDAQIPKGSTPAGLKYVIARDGKVVQGGLISLYINFKYEELIALKEPIPGAYQVKLALVDAAGKELVSRDDLRFDKKDEAKVFAHWWNNKRGDPEKVLQPFAPIRVDGETAAVTRRVYTLDGLGLPRQIEANGGKVLTAPARIVVTVGGKEHVVPTNGTVTYTSKKDWRTEFAGKTAVAGLAFTVTGWMEQDGLVNLDLTYAPENGPVAIEDFRVEWPVDDAHGNWMQCIGGVGGNYAPRTIGQVPALSSAAGPAGTGTVWDSLTDIGKAGSKMVVGNWENNLWVGNDQRGLCWFGDDDRGWVPNDATPAHSLFRAGKAVVMRNHIINLPKGAPAFVLEAPRTINLQYNATPFRHLAKGWRLTQVSACNGFSRGDYKFDEEEKKDFFTILSMPSKDPARWPYYLEKYKKSADFIADKSGPFSISPRLTWFLTNQIALRGYAEKTLEPGMYNYFRADWSTEYDGESLNKTYRDYMLYLMDMHVRQGGLTHYYFDISFTRSTPALAAGLGYRLPDGRVQPGSMDGPLREWYKRVWALMQEHDLYPGGVSGHATHSIPLRALPWMDSVLDAEYPIRDAVTVYTKDAMIAMSCPHNFGVKIDHHSHMDPRWTTMFDAGMGAGGGKFNTTGFRHFGIAAEDVAFLGFWRNGQLIKPADKGVLVSAWKRPGKLMLQVYNYGLDPEGEEKTRSGRLKLDLRALGAPANLQDGQVRIREVVVDPDNRVPGGSTIFGWYQHLLAQPRWANDQTPRIRPALHPTITPDGWVDNVHIFYHDCRFLEITWDDAPVQQDAVSAAVGPANAERALHWGIGRATAADAQVKAATDGLLVKAWTQPGTAMLVVRNPGAKAADAALTADLKALGVQIPKRWTAYTQCLGGDLDPATGALTLKGLKPGEARLVFIDTFAQ
jgi:hypothetical protein